MLNLFFPLCYHIFEDIFQRKERPHPIQHRKWMRAERKRIRDKEACSEKIPYVIGKCFGFHFARLVQQKNTRIIPAPITPMTVTLSIFLCGGSENRTRVSCLGSTHIATILYPQILKGEGSICSATKPYPQILKRFFTHESCLMNHFLPNHAVTYPHIVCFCADSTGASASSSIITTIFSPGFAT